MDSLFLSAIKQYDKMRTPGMWEAKEIDDSHADVWLADGFALCDELKTGDFICEMDNTATDQWENAQFIAACSWAIPMMIAEIERLQDLTQANKEIVETASNG